MQPLIRSLQDPGVWPHPVDEVEVLETHISWILLAGDFAYKIKKPVDFGFVDFTTLERRRFFCEEELRLNRRLAPELYLTVVPIAGTAECPRPGGDGKPIEFAVKMKRFPQEELLSRLIERGELTAQHVDCLALEVAGFHARVAVADSESSPFGTPAQVFEPVEENFRHLDLADQSDAPRSEIDALREWSTRQFHARHGDFSARKKAGFVRECHGDMHSGNMIVPGRESRVEGREPDGQTPESDNVVIFDCIEFNESFRWIDVMSEAAFVVMDFEDRGRPDFARRFLNAYLEQTGDYAGLCVLPFYLVYRALVRAKVALLRAAQDDADENERAALRRDFRRHVELAAGYTRPRPTPLIITHGFSGSGKTTGTQPLVEQLGGVRLRSDVERPRLFGGDRSATPLDELDAGLYTPERTARTYDELANLAASVTRAGFPAIVDATFLKRPQREQFRQLAEQLGVDFFIADFQAPEKELRDRIIKRASAGTDASEADLAVLEHQLKTHDPLGNDEQQRAVEPSELLRKFVKA